MQFFTKYRYISMLKFIAFYVKGEKECSLIYRKNIIYLYEMHFKFPYFCLYKSQKADKKHWNISGWYQVCCEKWDLNIFRFLFKKKEKEKGFYFI